MAGARSERIGARSKTCTPRERTLSWPGLGASASRPDRRRALLASARCPKVSRLSDYPQGGPLLKALQKLLTPGESFQRVGSRARQLVWRAVGIGFGDISLRTAPCSVRRTPGRI